MKNIFVLPTDKPSRLLQCLKVIELLDKKWLSPIGKVNRNIYITDDSEIKVGDWSYDSRGFVEKVDESYDLEVINALGKKIILTTDPKLIADGVQAIDDEFLQWFVNNSSCEKVEVELIDTFKKTNEVYVDEITGGNYYEIIKQYKIITPQEEPKQETTLEEAYLNKLIDEANKEFTLDRKLAKDVAIKYAKWRQEQDKKMYSEKEMLDFSEWVSHNDWVYLPSKGYWVNEEQEELEENFTTKELFEQFKNK
jgi:hypothetical protein